MGSNEGVKQAGKQQRAKQQAKKSPHMQGVIQLFFQSRQVFLAVALSKYGNIYMNDINRNQGGVNYERVIQVRRSLHPVNPEQMHEIIKTAGCSTRFADDGMAFFTYTVGRCEYPLDPFGSYTNKWVGEQCKAQGFTRPADYPAALAGAMLVATEQAARMAFEGGRA